MSAQLLPAEVLRGFHIQQTQELQPGNFRHHSSQRANYSKPVFSGVTEALEFPRAEGDRDKAGKRRSHCLTFLQRLRVMYTRRCWIQGLFPSCQFNSRIKSQVLPLVPLELSCICTEQSSRPYTELGNGFPVPFPGFPASSLWMN